MIKPESVREAIINRVVTVGLMEKGRSWHRLEGGEKGSLTDIWRKSVPGKGNRQCKCPGAESHGYLRVGRKPARLETQK